jgi:hypothetical protein
MRYDRVLLKSSLGEDGVQWEVTRIKLLGTAVIAHEGKRPVYPSDHFGLLTWLSTNPESPPPQQIISDRDRVVSGISFADMLKRK